MALTLTEFKEQMAQSSKQSYRGDCQLCGNPIVDQQHDDDKYICVAGDYQLTHSDCYYDLMSADIDQQPIFMPRALHAA